MLSRQKFTVEASLPAMSSKDALEYLQKFFDFFHPTFCAQVQLVEQVKPESDPSLD